MTTNGTCQKWSYGNREQVSLMRPIYIENRILELKQVVLIVRVVLISSGHYNGPLLYIVNFQ